jgi:hypothetical protein
MVVAVEEMVRLIPTYRIDDSIPVKRHLGYVQGLDQMHIVVD